MLVLGQETGAHGTYRQPHDLGLDCHNKPLARQDKQMNSYQEDFPFFGPTIS